MSKIGERLISGLKAETTNTSFDSFSSSIPERSGTSLGANLADFVGSTLYGAIDSAAFGIPTIIAEKDKVEEYQGLGKRSKVKYDNFLDDIGIQPLEAESNWGRAGRGVGEAIGFFVPFTGTTKALRVATSPLISRTARGALTSIDDAVRTGVRSTTSLTDSIKAISKSIDNGVAGAMSKGSFSANTTNGVEAIVKSFIKKVDNINPIMKSSIDDIERLGFRMERGVSQSVSKYLKETGKFSNSQIRQISEELGSNVSKNLMNAGKNNRFIDDIDGYITDLVTRSGEKFGLTGKASRIVAGYIGRSISTTVDFYAFDTVSKMARSMAGAESEFNVPKDLKESAEFSFIVSLAEMISPVNKRASALKDFIRLARAGSSSKRSWVKMYKDGNISSSQLRQAVRYFSSLGRKTPFGKSGKDIITSGVSEKKLAEWLDKTYATNRKELKSLVSDDAKRGMLYALPRAAFDATATAMYFSSKDDRSVFSMFDDEYVIGDFVMGALMAMRNPGSLDRDARVRFRSNDNIAQKFSLLEAMGADIKPLKRTLRYQSELYRDVYSSVAVKEDLPEFQEIINIFESIPDKEIAEPVGVDQLSSEQSNMLAELYNNFFLPKKILDLQITDPSDLTRLKQEGIITSVEQLSSKQYRDLWSRVKNIETSQGKKIEDYENFDTLYEDILQSSVNNQREHLIASLSKFGDAFGLTKLDYTLDTNRNKDQVALEMYMPDKAEMNLDSDNQDAFDFMVNLMNAAEKSGMITIVGRNDDKQRRKPKNVDVAKEQLMEIVKDYSSVVEKLDPNFQYSTPDNPALSLISEYMSFSKKNDLSLALEGKERESNRELLNLIESTLGTTVNSTGEVEIDMSGVDEKSIDKDELEKAKRVLESFTGLKIISGQSDARTSPIKVHYDKAMNFLTKMESDTGFGLVNADGPVIRIANTEVQYLQREIGRKVFERSDLNVNDYIAINRLASGLEANLNSDGKMVLPSLGDMETILTSKFGESGKSFLGKYNDLLKRLRPTGKIVEIDGYNMKDINNKDIGLIIESAYNISNNVYFSDLSALKETFTGTEFQEKVKEYQKLVQEFTKDVNFEKLNKIKVLSEEIAASGFSFDIDKNLFKEIDRAIASEDMSRLTKTLFDNHLVNIKEYYGDIDRLFKEVRKITSNNDSFGAASSQGFFVRNKILEYLGDNYEGKQKTLAELAMDYLDNGASYKELTDLINHSNRLYANRVPEGAIREQDEIAAKEISELKDKFASLDHDHTKQQYVNTIQKANIDGILNDDGTDISVLLKEDLLSDNEDVRDDAIDKLFEAKRKAEKDKFDEDDATLSVLSVVKSSIGRKEKRKSYSVVLSGDTAVLRYDKDEVSTATPLTVFTNSRNGFGILKDEYVTSSSRKSSIIGDWNNVKKILNIGIASEKRDFPNEELSKKANVEAQATRFEIIPVQGNSEFAITFEPTAENMRELGREIDEWYSNMEQYLSNNPEKLRLFRAHFQDSYNKYKDVENKKEREAMIRGLYYTKISKDFFIETLGEKFDVTNVRKRQAKMYKYSHVPNNKNGIRVDKVLADAMAATYRKNSSSRMERNASLIEKRKNNGLNISVFRDEYEIDGVKTTAEESVRIFIKNTILQKGMSEEIADELSETTLSNLKNTKDFSKRKMDSIAQAITDGAVFASKEAMETDMAIFGGEFDNGQTSYKGVIYNNKNSSGDENVSVIGKQNIFYDPEIAKVMPKGVDYLMPTSVAKVWGGDVAEFKDFNMNKSLSENISNLSLTSENFSIDTINYLFPAHQTGKGRANPSVTHFFDREALSDYTKQLDIEGIITQIGDVLNARNNTSGMRKMLLEKFEDLGQQYDSYTGLERLILLGDSVDNTFVRDQVLRIFKSMTIDKTLKKTSDTIVNGFLKGDHRLASPIYDKRNNDYSDQYVKRFGEVRLPNNSSRINFSDLNSTIIFEINKDGDFQDYQLGADGKVYDPSLKENSQIDSSVEEVSNSVNEIYKMLKDTNLGSAKYMLDRVNEIISDGSIGKGEIASYKAISKVIDLVKKKIGQNDDIVDVAKAILSISRAGVRELSIGVNTHKIPKKYISDSIVNRLEGFSSKEDGNVIHVNNYEIAVNHQADQDGDKIWVYTSMPPSVLRTSANNMSLGKDFAQIKTTTPDPNFYNTNADNGLGKDGAGGSMIEHMRRIQQSRNVIGQVVKIQGATTMLSASNFSINGNSVLNVNNKEAINFNNRLVSVLQNSLDPHNGIADELLNPNKLKDFLLFGDKLSDKITDTPNEISEFKGFMNVEDIATSLGVDYENSPDDVAIIKDALREVFDVYSMVYSASSDVYESGVGRSPNIDEYADIWRDFDRFQKNPTEFIFETLSRKYYYRDRSKSNEGFENVNKLKEILTKPTEGKKQLRKTFRELFKMDDISNDYPQMSLVKNIATKNLDTDNFEHSIRINEQLDSILGIERSSIVERALGTSSKNKSLFFNGINGENYDELFNENFDEMFKNSSNSIRLAERVGNHIYVFNKKIDQLQSKLSFYESRGYNTFTLEDRIADLKDKRDKLDKKLYDAGTNYWKDNEQKIRKDLSVKKGYFKNNGKKTIHIYKKVGESIQFVEAIQPGDSKQLFNSDNYIALYNPLKIEPINKVEFKEGLAMELASNHKEVTSILNHLSDRYNINGEKFYDNIVRFATTAKSNLRDSRSKAIEQNKNARQLSDDIWSRNTYERDVIFEKMYDQINNFIFDNNFNENDTNEAFKVVASILMKPNIVQNSVVRDGNVPIPYYKNEKNWIKSLFSADSNLKNGTMQGHMDNIFKSFGRRVREIDNGTGSNVLDINDGLSPNARWKNFQKNSKLSRSLYMYSGLNPRLKRFANSLTMERTITKDLRESIKAVNDLDKSNCVY